MVRWSVCFAFPRTEKRTWVVRSSCPLWVKADFNIAVDRVRLPPPKRTSPATNAIAGLEISKRYGGSRYLYSCEGETPQLVRIGDARHPSHKGGKGRKSRVAQLPLLPQRLQDLHQFGVDEFVAADQVAGLEWITLTIDAADDAAGFAHDDRTGRHVPR